MKKMAAGSFKTNCLAVMDEVCAKRETIVITKHGKPVAKAELEKAKAELAETGNRLGAVQTPIPGPRKPAVSIARRGWPQAASFQPARSAATGAICQPRITTRPRCSDLLHAP